ncbi:MAG: phosphoglycerate dehydrogenase-like enzyme [Parasphingorhabdus sp.]|jgi:phosphoglycerate dehydrogenase-like enzyme
MKLLVQGAASATEIPGFGTLPKGVEVVFSKDENDLQRELPGSEALLLWDFKSRVLQQHWQSTTDLKWIQLCGAGADGVLFDELKNSDVVLTNAKGVFDRPMAETVLGYMLMVAKDFRTTLDHQQSKTWQYRMTRLLKGDTALIIGVGSIGREFARLLNSVGLKCSGAGRQARAGDADFDEIFASENIADIVGNFDWVIGVMPSTASTTGFFDKQIFDAMNSDAHFINMGRGTAVVESDIIAALESGDIAGAMLDVFCNEPLQESDPMWETKNLFVSPHISGDYAGFEENIIGIFKSNLDKYLSGQPLTNIVDKALGFVRS